ncbi:MAG: hypothetical protein JO147_05770 [Actinobacteria bacterium]|nr:hypothetical protein [Actinomycetota bacterium]
MRLPPLHRAVQIVSATLLVIAGAVSVAVVGNATASVHSPVADRPAGAAESSPTHPVAGPAVSAPALAASPATARDVLAARPVQRRLVPPSLSSASGSSADSSAGTQRTSAPAGGAGSGSGAGGSSGGSGTVNGSSSASAVSAVVNAVNAARAQAGLPALRTLGGLANSAAAHNAAMASANSLSHQLPGEPALGARESAAGISWSWAGECIGDTSSMTGAGAVSLVNAMLAEQPPNDGHRQIILSTSADALGVDVLLDNAHGRLWLTMDFARV